MVEGVDGNSGGLAGGGGGMGGIGIVGVLMGWLKGCLGGAKSRDAEDWLGMGEGRGGICGLSGGGIVVGWISRCVSPLASILSLVLTVFRNGRHGCLVLVRLYGKSG